MDKNVLLFYFFPCGSVCILCCINKPQFAVHHQTRIWNHTLKKVCEPFLYIYLFAIISKLTTKVVADVSPPETTASCRQNWWEDEKRKHTTGNVWWFLNLHAAYVSPTTATVITAGSFMAVELVHSTRLKHDKKLTDWAYSVWDCPETSTGTNCGSTFIIWSLSLYYYAILVLVRDEEWRRNDWGRCGV